MKLFSAELNLARNGDGSFKTCTSDGETLYQTRLGVFVREPESAWIANFVLGSFFGAMSLGSLVICVLWLSEVADFYQKHGFSQTFSLLMLTLPFGFAALLMFLRPSVRHCPAPAQQYRAEDVRGFRVRADGEDQ